MIYISIIMNKLIKNLGIVGVLGLSLVASNPTKSLTLENLSSSVVACENQLCYIDLNLDGKVDVIEDTEKYISYMDFSNADKILSQYQFPGKILPISDELKKSSLSVLGKYNR